MLKERKLWLSYILGDALDYEKFDLKVGLEIHQQLNTHKLFCNCPSRLSEERGSHFLRRLRPTQSELGEVDKAAIEEAKRNLRFRYQTSDSTCLVETDEEPPHHANEEAIDVALQIALLLEAEPVDEVHFMRKIVIDGSNTSGFQRTALIALNGSMTINSRKIGIPKICLEEDAARKIEERGEEVVYRLDRLGIPLIEIATSPDIKTPEEAKEVALNLGRLLRATKKVMRGIGTIREDLNISIPQGARVEVKGVQELRMIGTFVEKEVARQMMLLEVKEELRRRGVKEVASEILDLSKVFEDSSSRVIKQCLEKGGMVLGIKLTGFSGLLKNKLGPELNSHAKVVGVGGILHSDELPAYGITSEEVLKCGKDLSIEPEDAFVLVADEEGKARKALVEVLERAKLAVKGVPEETRDPLQDGSTVYSRPLPGKARMYPETDVPPIEVTKERIEKIKASLPEMPHVRMDRIMRQYGIHKQQVVQLVDEGRDDLFEELASRYGMAGTIARTFLNTLPELRSEGLEVERISPSTFHDLFRELAKGRFAKEGMPEILRYVLKENANVDTAISQLGIERIKKEEVEALLQGILEENIDIVREKGTDSLGPLMGMAMERLRGKADGKMISEILKEKLKQFKKEI